MARRPSLSPFAYIRRQGLYRGLLGGNRSWLVVGGTFWGVRVLRRAMGRTEQVVAVEVLKPGQAIRLEAIPAPTRSERKAVRAARKSS